MVMVLEWLQVDLVTNILTGVCSAYYDSVPCFFITGQVGQIHLKKNDKYRQFDFKKQM